MVRIFLIFGMKEREIQDAEFSRVELCGRKSLQREQ